MPLPANTTTVVVRGTFNTPEGNPSTGTVTFTPSAWLLNSGANIAIPNSGVTKTLGTAGDFSVTLPITDDSDISPNPFIYTVSEVVDGVSQSYNISIPGTVATGGTIYLADLAPVAAAGPEYYSLASSLSIGTVSTLAAGSAATATITGLAPSQTLNLGIPTGTTGATGAAATVTVGTIGSTPFPGPGTVTNSGTSGSAVLNFVLVTGQTGATGPQGNTGTLAVGTVGSVPNSGTASVTNVGSSTAGTFNFILRDGPTGPQGATGATGAQGPSATIAVGTVGSVPNSGTAVITNSGSSTAGTFDFILRDGPTGPQGATGAAATIAIGTVTSVAYGGTAAVTNVGSSTAGTFNFTLVTGPQGDLAGLSATAPLNYAANTFSLRYGAGLGTATGGTLVADFDTATPAALGVASAGTANKVSRSDHVHTLPTAAQVGAVGTATAVTAGTALAGGGDLSTSRTLNVVLASTNPAALGTAASPGTATASVARSDHVHALPTASDVGAVANSLISGTKGAVPVGTGSTVAALSPGSNGQTLVADSTQTNGLRYVDAQTARNAIINGNFAVWARGTSFTSANVYTADRWYKDDLGHTTVSRQSSGLTGFQYSLRSQRNSGQSSTSNYGVVHSLESADALQLAGKTATVSFYARAGANYSPTSSVLKLLFAVGTGTDQKRTFAAALTGETTLTTDFTLTTSWQRFSVSWSIATSTTALALQFYASPTGTASTNDWFELAGVQLEASPVATPFEFEPYEATLRKCQRYYYLHAEGQSRAVGNFSQYNSTRIDGVVHFPTTMRTSPSLVVTTGTDYFVFLRNDSFDAFNDLSIDAPNLNSAAVRTTSNISGTAGHGGWVYTNNASAVVAFSAEL